GGQSRSPNPLIRIRYNISNAKNVLNDVKNDILSCLSHQMYC
ncbi:hypothetical protein AVEN_158267-1, partial [Araneus ventricosus]